MGFDSRIENRMWIEEEVRILNLIAKIVSTFVMKERAHKKAVQVAKINKSILDNMNAYTYVVDMDTYELLFINKNAKKLSPKAKVGDKCYDIMWNDNFKSCNICPMKSLKNSDDIIKDAEFYNDVLNIWANATASKIEWIDGRKVCLITIYDITKYKMKDKEDNI